MAAPYLDRRDAGRQLAEALLQYADSAGVLVLGLPRGGVPVAYEVARRLHAPLDVLVVCKLGVPGQEELAMGAIASGGVTVVNSDVVEALGIPRERVEEAAGRELSEVARRERAYREGRPAPEIRGRTAILVDDGLATGSTMRAAVRALRQQGAKRIVVAVPVAARATCEEFRGESDEIVCLDTPEHFGAVGEWYYDFAQTTDGEVRELLARAEREQAAVR